MYVSLHFFSHRFLCRNQGRNMVSKAPKRSSHTAVSGDEGEHQVEMSHKRVRPVSLVSAVAGSCPTSSLSSPPPMSSLSTAAGPGPTSSSYSSALSSSSCSSGVTATSVSSSMSSPVSCDATSSSTTGHPAQEMTWCVHRFVCLHIH
jgi:hypothetical protein